MTSNRVEKVLVTSGVQAASLQALTASQYVVEVKGKAANTPLTVTDEFRISVKSPDGTILSGDWIKASRIKKFSKEAAVAKVEQVTTVTPGTLASNSEYNLTIVNIADREILSYRQNKRVYTLATGDTVNLAASLTALAAEINRDQASSVIATASATVLTLAAKSEQDKVDKAGIYGKQNILKVSFYKVETFGSQSVLQGAVAQTVAPVFGKGQGYQVRKLEDGQTGTQGYLNRTLFPADVYPFGSEVGSTYFTYVIEDDNKVSTNSTVLDISDAPRTNILASKVATALDLIFVNLVQ